MVGKLNAIHPESFPEPGHVLFYEHVGIRYVWGEVHREAQLINRD